MHRTAHSLLLLIALCATRAFAGVDGPTYLGPKPPAEVKRIVTLAPSITEIVIALGAGDRLVGVSQFDELEQVKSLPRVGGFIDPSIEAVLALHPDLLIVQPAPGNQAPVQKLAELGVPVLALPLHSVEETLTSMRAVGRVLGKAKEAEALCRDIERMREQIRAKAKAQPKVRVLIVYEWQPLVVAGPGSFADELMKDAGAINAAQSSDSPYPMYAVEAAVAAKPELIIDAAHDPTPAEKLRRLSGLKEARWERIPNEDLMHPGPNLGRALEGLYALIHPGEPSK